MVFNNGTGESSVFMPCTSFKIVSRESVIQHTTTPLSSINQDQKRQHPCIEKLHVKHL